MAIRTGRNLLSGASELLFPSTRAPAAQTKLRLSPRPGGGLDMDHVAVPFASFLWAMYFLAPSGFCLWASGIAKLKILTFLHNRKLITPMAHDPARMVGTLLLETFQAMHYTSMRVSKDGARLANFSYTRFPHLQHGKFKVAHLFAIDVDLDSKRMVKATLDDEPLAAQEAMLLIYFNAITADHVKMHAFANWAVNVEQSTNSYLYRMSLTSVMYNYFGFSIFPKICASWKYLQVSAYDLRDVSKVFEHGVREGVSSHAQVHELAKHSELVDFVVKVRNKFLNEFKRHRDDFPGIDGEALFVSTCVHSLDHQLLEWHLPDPLWISPDKVPEQLRAMAEVSQFVRVGFVPDPPGQFWHKRMKTAPGSFFRAVYAHAARINLRLADHMDACIAK